MGRACDPVWRSLAPLTVVQPGGVLALPLTALLDSHTHRTRQSRTATAAILACTTGVVLFMARAAAATITTQQLGTRTELAQIVTLPVSRSSSRLFRTMPRGTASGHTVREGPAIGWPSSWRRSGRRSGRGGGGQEVVQHLREAHGGATPGRAARPVNNSHPGHRTREGRVVIRGGVRDASAPCRGRVTVARPTLGVDRKRKGCRHG